MSRRLNYRVGGKSIEMNIIPELSDTANDKKLSTLKFSNGRKVPY